MATRKRKTQNNKSVAILTVVVECEAMPAREAVAAVIADAKSLGTVTKAELHRQPQPARVEDLRT